MNASTMGQDVRTAPTIDLSMLLNQASYAVTIRIGAALAEIPMSVKVYCVLKKGVDGAFTQAQLAERAWMDKTTMVNVLDEMEQGGLASRTMSPTDRRVRVVAITAQGRAQLAKADALVQATYDDVLDGLSVTRKAEFLSALTGLVEGPLAAPFHMEDQLPRTRRSKN